VKNLVKKTRFQGIIVYQKSKIGSIPLRRKTSFFLPTIPSHDTTYNSCVSAGETVNIKDRLSHLSFQEARKLLGPKGDRLIRQGGRYEIDIAAQVELDAKRFHVRLNGS